MYLNIFGCDHPDWGTENCANPTASPIGGALYFISFVLIGTMIVLNLFIGVIMNSMDEVRKEQAAVVAERWQSLLVLISASCAGFVTTGAGTGQGVPIVSLRFGRVSSSLIPSKDKK